MLKCIIVYFSQGGTTSRVAEAIASGLQLAEYKVDMYNIKDGSTPEIRDYDILGIGSPVYYYRPPFNVMDYLNGLPDLNGISAFVFVLYSTYQGDTSTTIRRILTHKGAREVGYFHCRGDDSFLGYLKMGYLFSPGHPVKEELAQARDFGRKLGANVAGEHYVKPEDDRPPAAVYRMERFLLNQWMCKTIYSRFFTADEKKCNRCGLCIKLCPTKNLTEDERGYPRWGHDCMACLTCELKCPEDAVSSPIDWPIFLPLLFYNVKKASRDSLLDYIRVKHIGGQIKLV